MIGSGLGLGPPDQPGHGSPTQAGQDAQKKGTEDVSHLHGSEQRCQVGCVEPHHFVIRSQGQLLDVQADPVPRVVQEWDDGLVSNQIDVGHVAGGRGQQGGEEGSTVDVVAVRGLEGEEDAGGRGLEHGSHAGCCTGREQDSDVLTSEPAAEPVSHSQTYGGPGVD